MIPILAAVSIAVFFMIRLTPADPINSITGGRRISAETRQALARQFGLDKPLPAQYLAWIGGLFRGDLGDSFGHRQPVKELLAQRLPTTIQLTLMSSFLAILLAIPMGILSAVNKNGPVDRLLSGLAVICVSSPAFLTAIVLMLIFSLRLRWFPVFGAGRGFLENCYYLFLPALALSLNMVALIARITRSRLIVELKSNYAMTETAKGTPFWRVVLEHCLKNSLIPVITVAGIQIGTMIVGAVLVENVFALGGLGALLIEGIKSSDYPVVQNIILFLVAMFLLINLAVDLVYAVIDPRIRVYRSHG